VRYKLNVHPAVRDYFRDFPGLTRKGRLRLYAAINDTAELSDAFRADPANRLAPGSPHLKLHHLFLDGNRIRGLTLVIDDSSAVYGILSINYADIY
jgi:hypothetical protein